MIDMTKLDWSSWLKPHGKQTGGATPQSTPQSGWQWDDPGNTAAPGFMGSGAYSKWWQGSDPDYDPNDPAVKQRWWRSPQVGGGIVWHPYFGWQDRSKVKDLYKADADNSVSWDEFSNWGLSKNTGEDWKQYFPDAVTDDYGSGGTGGGTGGGGLEWDGGTGGLIPFREGTGIGGGLGEAGPNTYGKEGSYWDEALGKIVKPGDEGYDPSKYIPDTGGGTGTGGGMTGSYVQNPPEWDTASFINTMMGLTGAPTDVDPWYQAAKAKTQRDVEEAIKQSNEQMGLGGMRWSTPLAGINARTAGDAFTNLGVEYAGQTMQAQEAARGRQMQAAGQLADLGQRYADYPLNVAGQAYQQGQGNTAQQQSDLDRLYKYFQSQTEENNPWLNLAYQLGTGSGINQQYTQGAGSGILGLLTSLLGKI